MTALPDLAAHGSTSIRRAHSATVVDRGQLSAATADWDGPVRSFMCIGMGGQGQVDRGQQLA